MSDSPGLPTKHPAPASASSEEQRFCNDALDSREFDSITDEQWVAMCEQVALDARRTIEDSEDSPKSAD